VATYLHYILDLTTALIYSWG